MIKIYRHQDAAGAYEVYRNAARHGSQPLYSAEQGMAWAPSDTIEDWFDPRLRAGRTWIWAPSDRVDGFITLMAAGHLDMFFVRPECRRGPAAPALYDALLADARDRGLSKLTTYASLLACRFLKRRGWQVTQEEMVARNGVSLPRARMQLAL